MIKSRANEHHKRAKVVSLVRPENAQQHFDGERDANESRVVDELGDADQSHPVLRAHR